VQLGGKRLSKTNQLDRLILVEWNMQIGPKPLVQFPPEEFFPSKETLLKIWAQHEMNPDLFFISFTEEEKLYCSLLKKFKTHIYFIVLQLNLKSDQRIFQEILENISNDLITNLDNPHFHHILSDIFKSIKNYSSLDEKHQYLRIFEDEIRIRILKTLRRGPITKIQIKDQLESQYGYKNLNIDLFLTSFLRLGLVIIQNIPGSEDSILLVKDVYGCLMPPNKQPMNTELLEKIKETFSNPQIIPIDKIRNIVKITNSKLAIKLFDEMEKLNNKGLEYKEAIQILNDDTKLFDQLILNSILFIDSEKKVYRVSEVHFYKNKINYLLPIIKKRYENGEISMEQLLQQISFFD
jgi:hypothetical protein